MSDLDSETLPPAETESGAMIKADLLAGLFFLIVGIAIFYLAWDMPRLETRRIHPATIPGLVPMLLGGSLALCGFLLAVRAARVEPVRNSWAVLGRTLVNTEAIRTFVLAALVLIYTLGLVGLVPFWLATGLFVFAFIMLYETVLAENAAPIARSVLWALVQAIIVAAVVTLVFERGFLVRLP
ncbi:tripartite tricarboxylate transporter TctB family protein [Pelagibacterium lentulum]|uniref:DUF1468 domain-containing protein n=1 Tax=Pelagibacterium lentulum TaxID=2029865 RepID=A0A916VTT4_9HYPH|nr:tripartite tricarboxylate transporter TctB family protein [Pelagibacterium lentulum]GGA36253.1 hypothetical protein GCM10011499_02000 [Pelagibacterium lentulum]